MSSKLKVNSASKKTQNSLPMKEIIQQSQLTNEVLKLLVARSEDIIILKSISDKKTGKLRLQSAFAEKTLQEIESKEDWRLMREDQILSQLVSSKVEAALHKKQFEKLTRKMMKVNAQFEEEPTENEINLTEIHVQKIMNIKVGPENTFITYNNKGQPCVTVPTGTISTVFLRDNISKSAKLIESFLTGECINIYPPTYYCVRYSRSNFVQEINRQKQALEQGNNCLSPNIAVIITSKRLKPSVNVQKAPSPVRKLVSLPDPDYRTPVFNLLNELNVEIYRKIKDFKAVFNERNQVARPCKSVDKIEKALRIRNYEKCAAVRPSGHSTKIPLNTVRTRGHLTAMPQIVFDLEDPYFEESKTIADRVKLIHYCIVIQKRFRYKRNKRLGIKAIIIQKHFRGFKVRKQVFLKKTENFRKVFHWERLKHWYPLMVNTIRERKGDFVLMDYSLVMESVILIQKNIRGALVRKHLTGWKREIALLRKMRGFDRFHKKKLMGWIKGVELEKGCLRMSKGFEEEAALFVGKEGSELTIESVRLKEMDARSEIMDKIKAERIKTLE